MDEMTAPEQMDEELPPEQETAEEKPAFFSIIKAVQSVLMAALLSASLFTLFTPSNLFTGSNIKEMLFSAENEESGSGLPTPDQGGSDNRIGIVSGHWKDAENSGYMCSDGLAENTYNLQVATMVSQELAELGYQVDLFDENAPRLSGYKALALVSIHTDTCEFISNDATGFKVAPALVSADPDAVNTLAQCMVEEYQANTGLQYQPNKRTVDMTTYHSFNEVNDATPAVIIKVGYLNLDREFLTKSTDKVVQGIVDGILCYVNPQSQEATAAP